MSSIGGGNISSGGGSSLMAFHHGGSTPSRRYYSCLTDAGNVNVDAPVSANLITLFPFIGGGVLDEIGFRQNAAGGAGTVVKLAVYQAASRLDLYPSALIADSGNIAADGANGAKTAIISPTLEDGVLYWLAFWASAAAGLRSHHIVPANQYGIWGMDSNLLQNQPNSALSLALAYGAYPDPFTSGATLLRNVNVPMVFVHYL